MNEHLFRKKALDRITGPESLNDYIKAAPVSVWLILGAVAAFLIGACLWGILGRVDSTVNSVVYVSDGEAYAYVLAENRSSLQTGMTVRTDAGEFTIASIGEDPYRMSKEDIQSAYAAYQLEPGTSSNVWLYEMTLTPAGEELPANGYYSAKIVTESMHPFRFILN